jgi:diguanylate cyclase (GGDEF)-like protein/PAS domain S-box-containing protein
MSYSIGSIFPHSEIPFNKAAPANPKLVVVGGSVANARAKEPQGAILIVDDEHLNLDMLSRRLQRSGFAVEVAASGLEALEKIRQQTFDLILLDQMMPEMSGVEVLRILRSDFSAEALPIIMVTAVAESDKIAEALSAGANDYITKPVDFQVAVARIRSQLVRKQAESVLRQSEERYALAAEASRDGVWDWNLLTGEVYFSQRWREMLGLAEDQVEGNKEAWFSRIVAGDREAVIAAVQQHVEGHSEVLRCGYRMLNAEGSMRWMSCRGIVTRDAAGRPVRLAGSQNDVTEEKTQDALTGIPNRLLMIGALESVISNAATVDGASAEYALLFLDLDGFKQVNDTLGHLAGDELLRSISGRLHGLVSQYDKDQPTPLHPIAARMGGDEFAILLKEGATPQAVQAFAKNLQQIMNSPFEIHGHIQYCAFSIGVALARGLHSGPEDILRDADIAMYTAKRQGRGEIVTFTEEMHDAALQQLDLENDIRLAVKRNELEIVYQPKVILSSGQTYGVEALVRWNHPVRGLLQPSAFISIAEETGVIVEIGRWVLEGACRQVRAWHDLFPARTPLELSVNLSPREFKQDDLVAGVERTLAATAFPPACLHLEITEGVLFEDLALARKTLEALKKTGLSIDIDDFGSGYSSLKYLRELPFDLLKIDRYFIGSLDSGKPGSGELIQTILSMASNLGLEVVAEGIETSQHSQQLQDLGCRLGQGYFYSKPISCTAMGVLLSKQQNPVPAELVPNAVETALELGCGV